MVMEGFQKTVRDALSQDPKATLSSISSFFQSSNLNSSSTSAASAKMSSTDHSHLLLSRPPRQMVSLWACSKLCAVCFVAGVFVGYTLKRRVRLWASKLLKRLKDN